MAVEHPTMGDISLVVEDPLRDVKLTTPSAVFRTRDGMLEWAPAGEVQPNPNARGLLQKFIDLHGKSDFLIGEFAAVYGVLGLTRQGQIEGSRGTLGPKQDLMEWVDDRGVFLERIAYWRPYIAALRYVCACFDRLRADSTTSPVDIMRDEGFPFETRENAPVLALQQQWEEFGLGNPDFTEQLPAWYLWNGPQVVADNLLRVGPENVLKWLCYFVTTTWVQIGGIHIGLESDGERVWAELKLGGLWVPGSHGIMPANSLRNVLAAQMLALATRPASDELIACSNCGRRYKPLRMPSKGQPHYCPDCKPIMAREQKRQWAARNRQAQRA